MEIEDVLNKYIVTHNKLGDPIVFTRRSHDRVHGSKIIPIINAFRQRKNIEKHEEYEFSYDSAKDFQRCGTKANHFIVELIGSNVNCLAIYVWLMNNSIFSPKQKKDGIHYYPALCKIRITIKGLSHILHVSDHSISHLFHLLTETRLGYIRRGLVILSPALLYKGSMKHYWQSVKYFNNLFKKRSK